MKKNEKKGERIESVELGQDRTTTTQVTKFPPPTAKTTGDWKIGSKGRCRQMPQPLASKRISREEGKGLEERERGERGERERGGPRTMGLGWVERERKGEAANTGVREKPTREAKVSRTDSMQIWSRTRKETRQGSPNTVEPGW